MRSFARVILDVENARRKGVQSRSITSEDRLNRPEPHRGDTMTGGIALADSASIVTYLSVGSALFLSIIIIIAIARQKAHEDFQNHVLLSANFLLVGACILNV